MMRLLEDTNPERLKAACISGPAVLAPDTLF